MGRFMGFLLAVVVLALAGCPAPTNRAPLFEFTSALSATTAVPATLDGSAATDPDADTLTFLWELTYVPDGSSLSVGSADIVDATSAVASFTPDVTGMWLVQLTVSDGALSVTRDTKLFSGDLGLGLEAHYLLNGDALDAGGISPAGTAAGMTWTVDRLGAAGNAGSFDGSTSRIDVAKQDFSGGMNVFTLSCWVKPTTNVSLEYFILSSGFGLAQDGDEIIFCVNIPETNNARATITPGEWHHVVGTYDGTDIKLYVDELLESTTNWPGNMATALRDLTIGYFLTNYWEGAIDDLWMFHRVIHYAEIELLHLYDAY